MVDNIEIQKIFIPLSSTVKVAEPNQNNASRHQGSFLNQPGEEESKDQKSRSKNDLSEDAEKTGERVGKSALWETEDESDKSSADYLEGIDEGGQKKLVDIIV
jgi:hypothetical protein